MSLKPGYKQTEVGVIPDDWEEVRLGDIGYIFGGLTGKSSEDFGTGNANYITFMNVISNVVSKESGVEKVSVGAGEHQSAVLPGDVLFNGSSETPEEVGFGSVVPQALAGTYLNSFCFGFRPNKDSDLDSKFFAYLTRSSLGREIIRPMAQGSTRYNLAKTNLLNGHFPRPPIKEQKAIAEALSDVDALINSLEALLIKKRNIKTGVMQELLTGRTRLPGFTGDWKEVRLGDLGACLRGVSYKGDSDLSDGDTPTTVRLLRSNNVQNSLIQFNDVQYVNHDCVSDEQILRRDDIVICMANGSKVLVGKTGLFKDSQDIRYTFGAFMGCFRSSSAQANAIFVRYLFLTNQYQDYISNLLAGSAINNLAPKSIESLLFVVPPLNEQKAISAVLSDIDDEIEALEKRLAKTRDLKQGMAQELLTGRTRLV